MARWDDLSPDIVSLILEWRREVTILPCAATRIQTQWRCYRFRTLLLRYKILRYLRDFRCWNPNAAEFMRRARL